MENQEKKALQKQNDKNIKLNQSPLKPLPQLL